MSTKYQASYLVEHKTGKKIKIGGCLRSQKAPPKARAYGTNRYTAEELPPKVDLREHMTKVEDQSRVNSCTANALVGAYEYLAKRILGFSGDVSRLFVYFNARKYDGIKGDQGSTICGSIAVLEEVGACTEETWPYDPKIVNRRPSEEAYEEAKRFLIEEAEEINVDLYAMKHCLAEGYPFAFGLLLFSSFDRARRKGIVPMPDLSTEEGRKTHGAHAMLCVGYSDKSQAFIVRNSWGEDWGDKGYCYIPYDYMTDPDLCWDCWTIRAVTDIDFSPDVWYEDDEEDYYYDDEDYDEEEDAYYYYDEEEDAYYYYDEEEDEYYYYDDDDDDDDEYEDDDDDEYEDDDDDEYEDDDEDDDDDEYEDDDEDDDDEYEDDDDDDDEYEDDDDDDDDDDEYEDDDDDDDDDDDEYEDDDDDDEYEDDDEDDD
jgi:C1A family cysteine protease